MTRRRSNTRLSLGLPLLALLLTAPPVPAQTLSHVESSLIRGEATTADLALTWLRRTPKSDATQLTIAADQTELSVCPSACQVLAAKRPLTRGQVDRLRSGLRTLGLSSLRGVEKEREASADRVLSLSHKGKKLGTWALPRGQWPIPSSGNEEEGLAAFLDELSERLFAEGTARKPVDLPKTKVDLEQVQIKLHLRPHTRPGGTVILVGTQARVTPEEGTLPRIPTPGPFTRKLSAEEQDRLLKNLQDAQLDRLEDTVPRREEAAIGDDDGRLVTLHILPSEAAADRVTPRGYKRFLADLVRSPAKGLVDQLTEIVLSPPRKLPPPPKNALEIAGRDDLTLKWQGPSGLAGSSAPLRFADLPADQRETLRQSVVIAAPYLDPLRRKASAPPTADERYLTIAVPTQGGDPTVFVFGASLATWRSGPTARLTEALEAQREGRKANLPELKGRYRDAHPPAHAR